MSLRLPRGSRNWHEVYLLGLAGLNGLAGLALPGSRSQAIEATFPIWGQYGWYVGLLAGAGLGIGGIALGTLTGLLVERAAMWLLTGLCAAYVLGALAVSGDRAATALGVALVAAFALANLARARQIARMVRRVQTQLRNGHGGEAR